jgi:DNA-binding PadR family transcriptional regulator
VPLEIDILETALDLAVHGTSEAHGFHLASRLRDRRGAKRLTAYGTLYKALERLEGMGFMESRWEDPQVAAADGRPRRRFYRVSVLGERAAADARAAEVPRAIQRPAAAVRT